MTEATTQDALTGGLKVAFTELRAITDDIPGCEIAVERNVWTTVEVYFGGERIGSLHEDRDDMTGASVLARCKGPACCVRTDRKCLGEWLTDQITMHRLWLLCQIDILRLTQERYEAAMKNANIKLVP